jgi:hypothetical protein
VQNAAGGKIVRIGIARALTGNHAYTTAGGNALRSRLDHGLIHQQRSGGEIFEIEVGIVAAGRKRGREVMFEVVFGDAVVVEEEALFIQERLFVQAFTHGN